MTTTNWTTSLPSDLGRPRADILEDDPTALMFHDGIPDRVRIPENSPIYAGEERLVSDHGLADCPITECEREVHHLRLDGPGGVHVAACVDHGWLVYQFVKRE